MKIVDVKLEIPASVAYRGSVKNVLGPVAVTQGDQEYLSIFDYSDAFSVFDWGRMPDALSGKGESLAILAAYFFEQLERPETWQEFSRSPEALALRKGNLFGAAFNDLGEKLQKQGLRTHYRGILEMTEKGMPLPVKDLSRLQRPSKYLLVKQVSVVRPQTVSLMGRQLCDYTPTRNAQPPRLIPLEVVFRFGCPEGSSLLSRVESHPGYLEQIGYGNLKIQPGVKWEFPVLELFTKLESSDRPVVLSEALSISGLSSSQLEEVLMRTVWIAGYLRMCFARAGLELADGKFEFAIDRDGSILLVDAIGPDELRLLQGKTQLSKEFLRKFYRKTDWYRAVTEAKEQAAQRGVQDWKKSVGVEAPALPPRYREAAEQVYRVLAQVLTGRSWRDGAWDLHRLVKEIASIEEEMGA